MLDETDSLVRGDEWMMDCLSAVRALDLPDCYVAAGFLRNAIWDALHHRHSRTPLHDIDVVYFDSTDTAPSREREAEAELRAARQHINWEVKNQARMHLRHGHVPYRDSEHAIAHWLETPTCVGIRLGVRDELAVVAPYGLAANWSLQVEPNPVIPYAGALYNDRIRRKHWVELWPKLKIAWAPES